MPAGDPIVCQECGETFPRRSNTGMIPRYCEPCARKGKNRASTEWKQRNPGKVEALRRKHKPRRAAAARARAASSTSEEKARRVRQRTALRYGLTLEEYDELYAGHKGACAICGEEQTGPRRLHVDHNHTTGQVRGLLCSNCNRGLGNFKEDPELFQKATDYLRAYDVLHRYVDKKSKGQE